MENQSLSMILEFTVPEPLSAALFDFASRWEAREFPAMQRTWPGYTDQDIEQELSDSTDFRHLHAQF